ncbi:MAG: methyltransferase type 11 [Deltaproteobacteria bacterium HGW-Deltaproteobacteria-15]|nr:MAG: methyltransferase type 11 [Deltaproteobacteria bacterium HGW-Deltaproteobacteria-15]
MPHVCPAWLGPLLLLNPLRRLMEKPGKMFHGLIEEGMIVLEPGCGMGYFTLPIARMVGPRGRVVAVDIQPKMISGLTRRAKKAGLLDRLDIRLATEEGMGLSDLNSVADLALAVHVVHEVTDQASFFKEVLDVLKPNGKLFVLEPFFHVSRKNMEQSISLAKEIGFKTLAQRTEMGGRSALLVKS